MGWAKYYEDNVSIYNGRIATGNWAGDTTPIIRKAENVIAQKNTHLAKKAVIIVKAEEVKQPKRTDGFSRNGIELIFHGKLDSCVSMKLQLNGWWWSKVKNCWCNADTTANRRYATIIASKQNASFALVRV